MSPPARRLALLAALAAAAPAAAQPAGPVVIDQVSLGDAFSGLDVVVPGEPEPFTADAYAAENAARIESPGRAEATVTQSASNTAIAQTILFGGPGEADVTAVADGRANAASIAGGGDRLHYLGDQSSAGFTQGDIAIAVDSAGSVAASASAVANTSEHAASGAFLGAFQTQVSNGALAAETFAAVNTASGAVALAANAVGNSVRSAGDGADVFVGAVQSTGAGVVLRGRTVADIGAAADVNIDAYATGNLAAASNPGGFITLGRDGSEVFQGNLSGVEAISNVSVEAWTGGAQAAAVAAGNLADASATGGEAALHAIQSNFGQVYARADFTGLSGANAGVGAFAAGNAWSAGCAACQAPVTGSAQQYNEAGVTAIGAASGHNRASAAAIGNLATATANGP